MDPLTRLLMQGAAGAAGGDVLGIEDVFSTWLYAGNNTTQTITNGIALADEVEIAPGTAIGGGYFAGFISHTADSVATHALIVAPAATGASGTGYPVTTDLQWRTSANTVGATSSFDGAANTALMTDSTAADFCTGLSIGGYSDWYLPARYELDIAYYNLKPTVDDNSTSWGINAYSVLKRTVNYTAGDPAQTSIAAFQTGGAEAFVAGPYFHWTSTEQSSTRGWAQRFIDGVHTDTLMTGTQPVRAFRKIPINDPLLDSYRVTGEGGLVWIKERNVTGSNHHLVDSARGVKNSLYTNSDVQQFDLSSTGPFGPPNGSISQFNSDGFYLDGPGYSSNQINASSNTYASWTFRKAPKFFDVVTYTGDGNNRTIAHNLGSVPGTIIVKRTDSTGDWQVYHRSLANTEYLVLNSTAAKATGTDRWNSTTPTSTVFSLGTNVAVNASGGTYVAYLFAHDAGGFGDSGAESVVKCGSYTGNGSTSGPVIDLGWEPQWVMVKLASGPGSNWWIQDNMRGMPTGGLTAGLKPDTSSPEDLSFNTIDLLPNGFQIKTTYGDFNDSSKTYIYIAIRRGPMKTPTDATEVFAVSSLASGAYTTTTNFPIDSAIVKSKSTVADWYMMSRMTGNTKYLNTNSDAAESTTGGAFNIDSNVTFTQNLVATNPLNYIFRRAPGFFDVVAYTGTGTTLNVAHNLGSAPGVIIARRRSGGEWWVYHGSLASSSSYLLLNSTGAVATGGPFQTGTPTSSSFSVQGGSVLNQSAITYIAYLFASCPGVSEVGSYTGTGTTLNIDCGFAAGARFVMIKRTDSTGDWYVWDTARGIVSGNDPYLLLNSTAAEVTSTDYIDPLASGFQITSTAPAAINASGGSFIFLAIA